MRSLPERSRVGRAWTEHSRLHSLAADSELKTDTHQQLTDTFQHYEKHLLRLQQHLLILSHTVHHVMRGESVPGVLTLNITEISTLVLVESSC